MSELVVALDVPGPDEAERMVDELYEFDLIFKIGLEPLLGYGDRLLAYCAARDVRCCIDAKLHDIPRTVAAAMAQIVRPCVRMVTVHALGGTAMLRAAVDAARARAEDLGIAEPLVFAVTVLTSLDQGDLAALGIAGTVSESALRLAALARDAGCAGVVCAAAEVRAIKAAFGDDLLTLVPGIRPAGAEPGDQRRASTPAGAIAAGADYLVVGRPIASAADRRAATAAILDAMTLQPR